MNNRLKGLKKSLILTMFVCLLLLSFTPFVQIQARQSIPSPSYEFYVYDEANIIGNEVSNYIIQTNENLFRQTNAQVVVAVVNSLEGESLEEYSNELYRQWGIGGQEEDNGILLLVALEERSLRIEIGYGLEGAIPDGKAGNIRDEYILPYFQQDQYEQGIFQGFQAIVHEIEQEYEIEIMPRDPAQYYENETPREEKGEMSLVQKIIMIAIMLGFLFIDFTFFGGMLTFTLLRGISRGNHRGGGRGGGNRGGGGSSGGGGASGRW